MILGPLNFIGADCKYLHTVDQPYQCAHYLDIKRTYLICIKNFNTCTTCFQYIITYFLFTYFRILKHMYLRMSQTYLHIFFMLMYFNTNLRSFNTYLHI